MSTPFKAACIQVNGSQDMDANISTACSMMRTARDRGADLVLAPENVALMEMQNRALIISRAVEEKSHPALAAFKELAKETGLWIMTGTLGIKLGEELVANRSFLISSEGNVVAKYDKIHMFDVDLEGGESYRESATFRPGEHAVVGQTPWGGLGMTVCYDLRFPHLYRALAKAGATMLTVPSAFTRKTGKAHWHTLLRARAIENGCYVFAPGQCGTHAQGRETFGHSLIIDPWGEILADGGEEPGIIMADIDPARVDEVRAMVPSLKHDREFAI